MNTVRLIQGFYHAYKDGEITQELPFYGWQSASNSLGDYLLCHTLDVWVVRDYVSNEIIGYPYDTYQEAKGFIEDLRADREVVSVSFVEPDTYEEDDHITLSHHWNVRYIPYHSDLHPNLLTMFELRQDATIKNDIVFYHNGRVLGVM